MDLFVPGSFTFPHIKFAFSFAFYYLIKQIAFVLYMYCINLFLSDVNLAQFYWDRWAKVTGHTGTERVNNGTKRPLPLNPN